MRDDPATAVDHGAAAPAIALRPLPWVISAEQPVGDLTPTTLPRHSTRPG